MGTAIVQEAQPERRMGKDITGGIMILLVREKVVASRLLQSVSLTGRRRPVTIRGSALAEAWGRAAPVVLPKPAGAT